MKIVIDANIPLGKEFFSSLGEVVAVPPREIENEHLVNADALVVRSVKKITGEMLKNTAVKFVGTCTAGFDHFDTQVIEQLGITWKNAPGCNAVPVVEYVFSVFSALKLSWRTGVVGVIGCGNVGGRLHQRLKQLNVECRCYDPYLDKNSNPDLCSLEEVLSSDIVCLHTPLSTEGAYPSYHLLNQTNLNQLKQGAVLINAGRGPVIDNKALLGFLKQREDIRCALDVWEDEPSIPIKLAEQVDIATPHIAGHSYDGKIRGTEQIYQSLCEHFDLVPTIKLQDLEPKPTFPSIVVDSTSDQLILEQAILAAYDVRDDHQHLISELRTGQNPASCFDRLRKQYQKRREFSCYNASLNKNNARLSADLKSLGFSVANFSVAN